MPGCLHTSLPSSHSLPPLSPPCLSGLSAKARDTHLLSTIGEGNGNPLQYSCLENPMEGGAWWATVRGIAEWDTAERLHFHFTVVYQAIACSFSTLLLSSLLHGPVVFLLSARRGNGIYGAPIVCLAAFLHSPCPLTLPVPSSLTSFFCSDCPFLGMKKQL